MRTFLQDLSHGLRLLTKNPAFATVAILTLALGIGANTAIFSVVNAVLLRPLPYKDPAHLMWIQESYGLGGPIGGMFAGVLSTDFSEWREKSRSFESMAAYDAMSRNLTGGGNEPEVVHVDEVTANFLDVLGVRPILGRGFVVSEERPGANDAAILTARLWRNRFGGDKDVIGKTLALDGRAYAIVGVLPASFHFEDEPDVLVPFTLEPNSSKPGDTVTLMIFNALGRLRPGVAPETAAVELQTLAPRTALFDTLRKQKFAVVVESLHAHLAGDLRPALLLFHAAVGLILLIACANVANILLARSSTRRREIAVRAALGASRGRLARQFLAESVALALLGGAAGVLLAFWGVDIYVRSLPEGLGTALRSAGEVRLDGAVLLFTLGLSCAAGIVFGIAPAWVAGRLDLNEALKEGGHVARISPGSGRVRNLIATIEIALALVLLTGAGLLIKDFVRLRSTKLGFNTSHLLTMMINLPLQRYAEPAAQSRFIAGLLDGGARVPGVQSVAVSSSVPLTSMDAEVTFTTSTGPNKMIEGSTEDAPSAVKPIGMESVSAAYFRTMGIPLMSGREFKASDAAGTTPVAMVNEAFVRRFWPHQTPLGKHVMRNDKDPGRMVVGVVGDVRHTNFEAAPEAKIYVPILQNTNTQFVLVARTPGDPLSVTSALRAQVLNLDPDQPVGDVMTMEQRLDASVAKPHFTLMVFGVFAGAALLLAAVGIYGVVSYGVAQRTQEMAIRLALGAHPGDLLRMVLRQGLKLAGAGIGLGLVGAFLLTRFLKTLLYGVSTTDPLTFAAVALILLGVALLACYVPAHRATRLAPLDALRYE